MKLSKKQNCNGCKALCGSTNSCELGYDNEAAKRFHGTAVNFRPTEECPKPMTNNDWIFALNNYKKTA